MDLDNIGTTIATRRFYMIGGDKEIVLSIGMPQQFPNSTDFFVPFQIVGVGSQRILCAAGIDRVQAIQQVMFVIGAKLHALNEQCGGRLRWEGDESGDLGFPIPKSAL